MGKPTLKFLTLVAICVLAAACGKDADVRTLKMAHSLDNNHPVHQAIVFMSDRLHDISGGKMKIDIYPGGQLGSERELMELLQIGSLAMTKVSSSPMEGFVPAMKVFNIPYVFRDNEHFWRVLNSRQGQDLLLAGDSVNLRGLGYFDAGSRSFYNVNTPVNKPEDLAGQKIRVQQSQTALKMVQALGGSPTPISWGELYTALSQGVVDGAENNPPSFYTSKHYEVCKYYTLNEHTSVPDIVLISSYIWSTLDAHQQQWLQQAMDEAVVYQRKLWAEKTEEALEAVEAAGVTIIRPDKAPFMAKVEAMHESYKGTELYDLIQTFKAM
ncbi:TRAP transporter substrate-binding protein [Gilvimarinus sp. SDUM040013]|uniref:TRAP transporter substrate-binding protein n=1 Tax=Gilvimarinus gilvus TaxID=3058038 RepID=A0ABU4RXX3_9GAMM|nr:TRAP transporter substrate-binding protein [Gilvimarinus sp. SDUM040013]MDO3386258.1 TRAP transporter substrate-binding protein [Gilvimarinus sp. SDUM040013]MDX6849747.1 TRAP transporter substrate-binding protein [Gilvimarinus sp. SDUM040013]